jgi:hypothetical protein
MIDAFVDEINFRILLERPKTWSVDNMAHIFLSGSDANKLGT